MTKKQYDELSAPLVRILLDMEDDILRLIAKQLARDGDFSDTSKWRIRQLARSGAMSKQAARLIKSYAEVQTAVSDDVIDTAALTEIGYLDEAVRESAAKGYFSGSTNIPAEQSAHSAAKAFQKQARSDLNLVNTVMTYAAKKAYVDAVNNTYFSTQERQRSLTPWAKAPPL